MPVKIYGSWFWRCLSLSAALCSPLRREESGCGVGTRIYSLTQIKKREVQGDILVTEPLGLHVYCNTKLWALICFSQEITANTLDFTQCRLSLSFQVNYSSSTSSLA